MNRRHSRNALLCLGLLWLGFAAYVWLTAPGLPEMVATHFGIHGQANGWMTRGRNVGVTLLAGVALPAFILALFAVIPRLPDRLLNIPHKDRWLAPARREATFDFVRRCGYWLAALLIGFVAGLHHLLIAANARTPAGLPMPDFTVFISLFVAAVTAWLVVLVRHFFRRPA